MKSWAGIKQDLLETWYDVVNSANAELIPYILPPALGSIAWHCGWRLNGGSVFEFTMHLLSVLAILMLGIVFVHRVRFFFQLTDVAAKRLENFGSFLLFIYCAIGTVNLFCGWRMAWLQLGYADWNTAALVIYLSGPTWSLMRAGWNHLQTRRFMFTHRIK